MKLLGNFQGIDIIQSDHLPVIGHRITLPAMQCRGDRRRKKRFVRKVRASAKPIHASYMVQGKLVVAPEHYEALKTHALQASRFGKDVKIPRYEGIIQGTIGA